MPLHGLSEMAGRHAIAHLTATGGGLRRAVHDGVAGRERIKRPDPSQLHQIVPEGAPGIEGL